MPALYTITTRASGTILTAAIYNADHQNHVNFGDAQHLGSFSQNQGQMQTQATPGDVGSESLAVSISDELARIRYMISQIRGTTYWYSASATQGAYPIGVVPAGFRNVLFNPSMWLAQRIGMTNGNNLGVGASTAIYQVDRWYMLTGANQV